MIKTLKWIIGDCVGAAIIILASFVFLGVHDEVKIDSVLNFLENLFVGILGGLIVTIFTSISQIAKERENLEDEFSVIIRKIIIKLVLMQTCSYNEIVKEIALLKELIINVKK